MTKTIGQARREAFEAKYPVPYYITWNVDRGGYYSIHRDSTRKRGAENYDAKWQGYNAALDSLCVVLPEMQIQVTDSDEGIRIYWPHEVIEAIHAAGVKTR